MSTRIANPFPILLDRTGYPLDGGKVYIGADGADPEVSPLACYSDSGLTIPLPQPITVIGGILTYDGNPVQVYVAASGYSMRARDANGAQVFYEPRAILDASNFQPLDSDLTAIAALTTTAFGRALLTQVDGAAVRGYVAAAKSGANTDITSLQDGTTIAAGGTIAPASVGYRGLPLSAQAQGALITLALTDAGKRVPNTTGGWSIPANGAVAFPVDTVIALYNNSAATQTVAITTDTLRWAGTTSTGTRTVAAYGWCWLTKVASTEWSCTGNLT